MSFFFSFTKLENKSMEQVLVWEDWYHWEAGGGGKRVWEGDYNENTVYTCVYCVHRGEGDKGEWWKGRIQYDIFDRRISVNATMYPHPAQQ
jgi:hypothetical protein